MTEIGDYVLPFYPAMKESFARFLDLPVAFQRKRADLLGPNASRVEFKASTADGVGEVKIEDGGARATICGASFDNVDEGGDILAAGAADVSIRSRLSKRLIKVFDRHEIGLAEADRMWIDGKRLFASGPVPDNAAGSEFRALVKSGFLAHGSIGYVPLQVKRETRDGEPVRILEEVKLFELSGVPWPMNEMAEGVQLSKGFGGIGSLSTKDGCKWECGLWGLTDVLNALATLRYYLQYCALDPNDAALAEMVIAQMTGVQTELATLLQIEPEPEAKDAAPEVETAEVVASATTPAEPLADGEQNIKRLLGQLSLVTAGANLQLQRHKGAAHGAGRNQEN